MNNRPIRDWFAGIFCWIMEVIHDCRMDIRSKRDARRGEPWSLPMSNGKE